MFHFLYLNLVIYRLDIRAKAEAKQNIVDLILTFNICSDECFAQIVKRLEEQENTAQDKEVRK